MQENLSDDEADDEGMRSNYDTASWFCGVVDVRSGWGFGGVGINLYFCAFQCRPNPGPAST